MAKLTVKLKHTDSHVYANDLRFEARMAFLDGRTARSKVLNKAADAMDARLRKVQVRA